MINLTLVGTGNVSSHLESVFEAAEGINLISVLSSRNIRLEHKVNTKTDIYVIAVSDDAISSVSEVFKHTNKLVVHTSGSVSLSALAEKNRKGVFYPLQTFTTGKKVDFSSIPICIEAEKKEDLDLLLKLANAISNSVYKISSKQRKSLHLAAVFVNNFTNHLYQIGSEVCKQNDVSFDILKPLILETAKKIESLAPIEAQTGPAIRKDSKTLERHLEEIQVKTHRAVYQTLTKSIQETHGKEL